MEKWLSIDPGELRNTVVIEQATETQGANGAIVQSWSTFYTTQAKIDPYAGGETFKSGALQSTNIHKITMRWFSGLTPKMRIRFGSRIYDIKNVENVLERNILYIVKCLERLYDETGDRVQ